MRKTPSKTLKQEQPRVDLLAWIDCLWKCFGRSNVNFRLLRRTILLSDSLLRGEFIQEKGIPNINMAIWSSAFIRGSPCQYNTNNNKPGCRTADPTVLAVGKYSAGVTRGKGSRLHAQDPDACFPGLPFKPSKQMTRIPKLRKGNPPKSRPSNTLHTA